MKARRHILKIAIALFVALLVAGLTGYFFSPQVLTMDSGAVKADALIVLGGGTLERPARAAELFKAGEAPLIICTGFGDAASHFAFLTNSGVPAAAIRLEPKARTTRENAIFTIALLRAQHLTNAILVTTWYHSRRALHCFKHYAPDIQFYSRPSYFGCPGANKAETLKPEMLKGEKAEGGGRAAEAARQKAEWQAVRHYTNLEYLKLLGYWVCYGVCPF